MASDFEMMLVRSALRWEEREHGVLQNGYAVSALGRVHAELPGSTFELVVRTETSMVSKMSAATNEGALQSSCRSATCGRR